MTLLAAIILKVGAALTAALLAALCLRHASAALRHWVLATGIGCAVLMPLFVLVVPAWQLASLPAAGGGVTTDTSFRVSAPAPATAAAVPAIVGQPGVDAVTVIAALWLIGAVAAFAMLAVGLVRLARIARQASPVEQDRCRVIAEAVACDYGIRRPVRLFYGRSPSLLVTWGVTRPAIILPAAARGWSDDRLRVVFCHEMAHIRRCDWATQLSADLLRACYWFNPLTWVACRRLRQESEHACDDAVIAAGVAGPTYAAQIVDLARTFAAHRAAWSPALPVARPSGLERRVRAMLNAQLNRHPLTLRARLLTTVAALGAAIALAGGALFAQGPFATVSGTLFDQQRAVLQGATLVMTNTKTQAKNEVRTDRGGRFELVGLPPGGYALDVRIAGFKPYRAELTLNGELIDRDIVLGVGTLEENITVTGPSAGETVTATPRMLEMLEKRRQAGLTAPCTLSDTPGVGGSIRPPMKIRDVRPLYPPALNDDKVAGTVLMDAVIGIDGNVRDVTVKKSAHPALDRAAGDAVKQWQFTETLLNCVPIEVTMTVTTTFKAQ
jgi:TonB family protein